MPLVSVVTTVRDGAPFIAECIGSTLAQTSADWELVVVDDGSTDGTWELIADFDDPRIRAVRSEPIGRAAALNRAVAEAEGEFIAILDADDRSLPDRHERQARHLSDHPDVAYVGAGQVPQIDENGDLLLLLDQHCTTHAEITARMRRGVCPTEHSTAMIRRELVERIGGYDTQLPCGLDHDLFVRLLEHGRVEHLREPVALKRIHSHQHYWGPRGVGQVARERFRYSRQVQRNTVRILGAPRWSTFTVPAGYWLRATLKPLVRPLTRSGRVWRRMGRGDRGTR